MLFNPIVANLHKIQTNRFHPILFKESPMPGSGPPIDKDKVALIRHKSVGHHTVEFDDRDAAIESCREIAKAESAKLCITEDFLWSGDEMPAMVVFFGEKDGEIVPVMG